MKRINLKDFYPFYEEDWSYYLMLERRFMQTNQYVELNTENFKTFSNEFASLLQIIGSEIDVFFKVFCEFEPEDRSKNIKDYADYVLRQWPDIIFQEVIAGEERLELVPFKGWDATKAGKSLLWWEAYNGIKHGRVRNKAEASLENVLNALAALFILEMKFFIRLTTQNDETDIPNEQSILFIMKGWNPEYRMMNKAYVRLLGNKLMIYTKPD